ncbi:hypothetical protein AVEN_180390-1 [Araneus ventricosus]|uniref:Uncharacterized protein n=1 Tax=Araneus ventricosus TaxID=182803 RepID=A0A4Y2MH51_ARAVE|nr:hypothetical protein AVEN_180390-1 [Araneus ventricosus]
MNFHPRGPHNRPQLKKLLGLHPVSSFGTNRLWLPTDKKCIKDVSKSRPAILLPEERGKYFKTQLRHSTKLKACNTDEQPWATLRRSKAVRSATHDRSRPQKWRGVAASQSIYSIYFVAHLIYRFAKDTDDTLLAQDIVRCCSIFVMP